MSQAASSILQDYAPVPRSALGPALNEQGYYVGRVERNLYWVTDGTYQSAFLTTSDGVVLLDATADDRSQPPAILIEKYTGVLAAADVFTGSTTFWVMESIRLDLGYGSQVHA